MHLFWTSICRSSLNLNSEEHTLGSNLTGKKVNLSVFPHLYLCYLLPFHHPVLGAFKEQNHQPKTSKLFLLTFSTKEKKNK